MGLFKDFKEDFSQAINELGPDGTPETNATDNLVVPARRLRRNCA